MYVCDMPLKIEHNFRVCVSVCGDVYVYISDEL